jgi:DNA-binding SARP family transcriptional activator
MITPEVRTPEEIVHRQHNHRRDALDRRGEPTQVEINVMGGFRVAVDGVLSPGAGWARRTASALVKILALAPGHCLHREKMMDLLWPDDPPTQSAPRLHKAAYFARRAAGRDDAVVLRDDVVSLFPGAEITVDAIQFERLARIAVGQKDPEAARQALAWYDGELLPGDRYEDWVIDRRELLHLRRLDVLRVAAEWRELAELDPSDEEAHVRLMRQHIGAGDGAAAIRQYEHLERVLERDLGVAPGDAVREVCVEACRLNGTQEAPRSSVAVGALLAELAGLVNRQSAVLAELVAAGIALPALAQ